MRAALLVACLTALLWNAAAGPAQAQGAGAETAERARIERERAAAQARFADSQRTCRERFVVTSCIETAERERREALARLRHDQYVLDEGLRKARAATRTEVIRSKANAQTARVSEAASRPAREAIRGASAARESSPRVVAEAASAVSRKSAQRVASGPASGRVKGAQRSAPDALRSRAAYDEAQRAAAAHRAEVEERVARRLKKRKPAAPLPLPAGVAPP